MGSKKQRYFTSKRIAALIGLIIFAALVGAVTYFVWKNFSLIASSPEALRDLMTSYGAGSYFVAIGIQILQVFIALIPGEVVEIGIGYAFGFIVGTLLCLCGVAIGSVPILLLTKRFGTRFVEIFVDREKIESLSFIRDEKKLHGLIFLLFFIPGTPKDLLTYFVGLTPIRITDFLVITLIARIPSIVSSTAGGHFAAEGDYLTSAIIFIATGAVSVFGLWLYRHISDRKQNNKQQ